MGRAMAGRFEYVRRRMAEGATLHTVGQELGVTRERVRQICRAQGIQVPRAEARKTHRAALEALWREGFSDAEIAVRLGRRREEICKVRCAMGLGPNLKRGGQPRLSPRLAKQITEQKRAYWERLARDPSLRSA